MKAKNIASTLIIAIGVVIILIYGKNIIMPLVLAVMIWFLLKVIRNGLALIKFKGKEMATWLRSTLSFVVVFAILGGIGKVLANQIANISEVLPVYEQNIGVMITKINQQFGIDIYAMFEDYSGDFEFSGLIAGILNSISDILGSAFMVIIYVVFLMLEESVFPYKMKALFKEADRFEKAHNILNKLNKSINSYISLKTLVSLITGVASFIVLLIIGVDFAFFWAFLIFTLNYIPTIGSLIATMFPSIIALIQFSSYSHFFLVLALIGAVQIAVGNLIEPRIMGQTLNISPLVVIIALTFWGALWGVLGMILSVPITVMMIIVFAQFEQTRNVAVLLSARGKV